MFDTFKRHWPHYLAEAGGLAFFMMNAAWITTLLEYPGSPVHQAIASPFLRRIPLGIAMGLVTAIILYNPLGKRSGAHINPAVTWATFRLGKIDRPDALFYVLFQFLGALAAAFTMKALLGEPFAHEKVRFAATVAAPGTAPWLTFLAEAAATFFLVFAFLTLAAHQTLKGFAGATASVLIMLYLWFETPLSGMSLNPARTFGSAVAGNVWERGWIYFTAPPLGALLAAELFVKLRRGAGGPSALPHHPLEKERPALPVLSLSVPIGVAHTGAPS